MIANDAVMMIDMLNHDVEEEEDETGKEVGTRPAGSATVSLTARTP